MSHKSGVLQKNQQSHRINITTKPWKIKKTIKNYGKQNGLFAQVFVCRKRETS